MWKLICASYTDGTEPADRCKELGINKDQTAVYSLVFDVNNTSLLFTMVLLDQDDEYLHLFSFTTINEDVAGVQWSLVAVMSGK